jgi:methyltransferase (TIGR00027 family)
MRHSPFPLASSPLDERPSLTAFVAALDRAVAARQGRVRGFADPFARALLPSALARARRLFDWATRAVFGDSSLVAPLRTVAIDEAIRACPRPQLVILGAGLDARAWRMPELADTVVFEIDRPATQRYKRAQLGTHPHAARRLLFVPVDFARDRLAQRLAAVGHDATQPTFWLCECVIPYLERASIRELFAAIATRSAPRSRLALMYTEPTLALWLTGLFLRQNGEPLRSHFRAPALARELERAGLHVVDDSCTLDWARRWAEPPWRLARGYRRMLRLALADKK